MATTAKKTTATKAPARSAAARKVAAKPPVKKAAATVVKRRRPPKAILEAKVLGVSELCDFLGVQRSTVHVWGYRGQLPPPDHPSVNGFKAWNRATIIKWAAQTGRLDQRCPWLHEEGERYLPPGGFVRRRRATAG